MLKTIDLPFSPILKLLMLCRILYNSLPNISEIGGTISTMEKTRGFDLRR